MAVFASTRLEKLSRYQERLRHSRLATTADLYTHKTDSINRETANHLDKFNPQTRSKKIH
jgi:uncharacterized membrane protein